MSTETIRVSLPSDIVRKYEDQASARGGQPAEWLMSERLRQFASVNSQKPITIDDVTRRKIESLVGRNISTADELVAVVESAVSVRLDDMEIPMSLQLLARLRTRCIGIEFNKFLPPLIKRLLEEFTGLR